MAPFNPNTAKRKTTNTTSSAKHGVANRASKKAAEGGTRSIGTTADEAGLQDRLTSLSNDLLFCILTMLSVHDAAQTTMLSKPWEHLFSECQSDTIDDKYVCLAPWLETGCSLPLWERCSNGISGALINTLVKGRRSICRFILEQTLPSQLAISSWLNMLSLVGVVEEIVLKMPCPKLDLPHFILNCISLRSLSLSNFRWPHLDPNRAPVSYNPSWTLPLLAELTLRLMDMTTQDVMDLLQRCPALPSLSLCCPRQGGGLVIQCKNLLSLTIEGGKEAANYNLVVIQDVPKLERLLAKPSLGCTAQNAMPRLHTAGIFQKHGIKVVFGQLRTVAFIINLDDSGEVQMVIVSLRNLPQLETLHMQMKTGPSDTKGKPASFEEIAGGPITCLENSLKKIVLRVQYLNRRKLEFANFLLGAAKALKSMLIYNNRMAGELLCPESRGSPGAQVVFIQNTKCTLELNTCASNYKLADPFMP